MNHVMKIFVIFLLFLGVDSVSGENVVDKKLYEGKQYRLRRLINHSPVIYIDPPNDTTDIFAQYKDDRLFLYQKDRNILLTKLKFKDMGAKIIIEIRNQDIGEQKIEIISPKGTKISLEVFNSLFDRIFSDPSDSSSYPYLVIDDTKGRIHVRGANHLPRNPIYVNTKSLIEYNDYHRCGACFRRHVRIPGYGIEVALRNQAKETYQIFHNILIYDSVQERVSKIGQKVIDNWPLALRGYDYEIWAIKDRSANAMALPTGVIYLTAGMLELAENDIELEAIIAREIAHVELRHAYRSLLRRNKKSLLGGALSIAATFGTALLSKDEDITDAMAEFSSSIAELAVNISMGNYDRNQEFEADDLALLYLTMTYGNSSGTSLSNILRRMKYADGLVEDRINSDTYDSHPTVIARSKRLNSLSMKKLEPGIGFIGLDTLGRQAAEIDLLYYTAYTGWKWSNGERVSRNVTVLYTSIKTTEYLYENSKVKHFSIKFNDTKYKFDNKEDNEIAPLSQAICVFICESKVPFYIENLEEFDLELGKRLEWTTKQ